MSRNGRAGLADHVGHRVQIRGVFEAAASPSPPFVVALVRRPIILLPDGGCCTPDHVWVRRANLLALYRRGEDITFSPTITVYHRRGDPTPEFGLEDVRDVQSLPLPPALMTIRKAAIA
jgi:hypothetical protein